jgi:hypothetical protein
MSAQLERPAAPAWAPALLVKLFVLEYARTYKQTLAGTPAQLGAHAMLAHALAVLDNTSLEIPALLVQSPALHAVAVLRTNV